MRARRFFIGLVLTGLVFGGMALPAEALFGVSAPPVPTAGDLTSLTTSLIPATPTVTPPTIDPDNPQLPTLPTVQVPTGLQPAMGVLSPAAVASCQASYLGPLVGIVVLTTLFDTAGVEPPVKPSFLGPLFGPVLTACVLAPFPEISSCGPDSTITDRLAGLPEVPGAGPVPVADPFASVPAPFASVVVVLKAIQYDIQYYVYGGNPGLKFANRVAAQLNCT